MKKEIIHRLLDRILKIQGQKIVTLVIRKFPIRIDIDARGQFGYHEGHKELFIAKLYRALDEGGAITIRQFLPVSVSRKLENGKKEWLPEKNLYGVRFQDGDWEGMSSEALKEAYEIDSITGSPIKREEGVHYQDFL